MLLLYHSQESPADQAHPYLHSTMLLLYRTIRAPSRIRISYLHSTMLLLYRCPSTRRLPGSAIYIPLCFYFIKAEAGDFSSTVTDLHSTMLLLYPGLLSDKTGKSYIYIPLCFYFIATGQFGELLDRLFTFHYASTLSVLLRRLLQLFLYLHSTMLLLYRREKAKMFWRFPRIYIPLCFYFISDKHPKDPQPLSFTFHYASTLSLYSTALPHTKPYLHSTMLLLYHRGMPVQEVAEFHLHSTMLLLYRIECPSGWICAKEFTFHYASTLSYGIEIVARGFSHIYIPLCFYFISTENFGTDVRV